MILHGDLSRIESTGIFRENSPHSENLNGITTLNNCIIGQSKYLYMDIGGTYTKIVDGSIVKGNISSLVRYEETSKYHNIVDIVKACKVDELDAVYVSVAGRYFLGKYYSDDISFLNKPSLEIVKSIKRSCNIEDVILVNDVVAASISVEEIMQDGEKCLVVGFGTGVSQSLVLKNDRNITVISGESGFVESNYEQRIKNQNYLIRDKVHMMGTTNIQRVTQLSEIAYYLVELGCVYIPDTIRIFGGLVSNTSNEDVIGCIKTEMNRYILGKRSISTMLSSIELEILPLHSPLIGIMKLSNKKSTYLLN